MLTKVGKEFHWEMSHRLPFHKGACKNIHGHSYRMILELSGYKDENGMVLDFYDIDSIVMPWVNLLDHCFLVDSADSVLFDFVKNNGFKHHVVDKVTTCENLAEILMNDFKAKFSGFKNLKNLSVRIFETVDAYAEVCTEL